MSYFAFLCRAQVSATHFTVIGNVCKVLTVLINICIWDKHASSQGVFYLFVCLVAAFFYKPSPLRAPPQPTPEQESLVGDDNADRGADSDVEGGPPSSPNPTQKLSSAPLSGCK